MGGGRGARVNPGAIHALHDAHAPSSIATPLLLLGKDAKDARAIAKMLEPSVGVTKLKIGAKGAAGAATSSSVAAPTTTSAMKLLSSSAAAPLSVRPLTPGAKGRNLLKRGFGAGAVEPPSPAMREAMSGMVHAKTPAFLPGRSGGFGGSRGVTFNTEVSHEPLKRADGPIGSGELLGPIDSDMLSMLREPEAGDDSAVMCVPRCAFLPVAPAVYATPTC